MKALGLALIFAFPYSQLFLILVAYGLNVLGNWQRTKSDMAQMKWRPFWKARFDWKLADGLAVAFYIIAIVTAVMYFFVMVSIER